MRLEGWAPVLLLPNRAVPQGEVTSALTDRQLVALLSELLGAD
jgi:hypothetical protein